MLIALASGETHGYAVMRFVDRLTDGAVRLPPGTMYRTMSRLVADGLVKEETDASDPDAPHDARRRYYRLTELGRRIAQEQAVFLSRVVAAADAAGLLGGSA